VIGLCKDLYESMGHQNIKTALSDKKFIEEFLTKYKNNP
jgi:hypothetical protein